MTEQTKVAIITYLNLLKNYNESIQNPNNPTDTITIKEIRNELRMSMNIIASTQGNGIEETLSKAHINKHEWDDIIIYLFDIISFYPNADTINCSNSSFCDPKAGLYSIRLLSNICTNNKHTSQIVQNYLSHKTEKKSNYISDMINGFSSQCTKSASSSLFMEATCTLVYNSCVSLSYDQMISFCSSLIQDIDFIYMILSSDEEMATLLLCKLNIIGLFPALYDSVSNNGKCLDYQLKLIQSFLIDDTILHAMKDELRRNIFSCFVKTIISHEDTNHQNEKRNDAIIEILANYFQTGKEQDTTNQVYNDRIHIATNHKSFFQYILSSLCIILHPFLLQKEMEVKGLVKSAKSSSISDIIRIRVLSMIRLIGNLCYQCRIHQDLLREEIVVPNESGMTGLNLLLSSTSLPFVMGVGIQEWCIVAIRYAMEDNIENQTIVYSLQQI